MKTITGLCKKILDYSVDLRRISVYILLCGRCEETESVFVSGNGKDCDSLYVEQA